MSYRPVSQHSATLCLDHIVPDYNMIRVDCFQEIQIWSSNLLHHLQFVCLRSFKEIDSNKSLSTQFVLLRRGLKSRRNELKTKWSLSCKEQNWFLCIVFFLPAIFLVTLLYKHIYVLSMCDKDCKWTLQWFLIGHW